MSSHQIGRKEVLDLLGKKIADIKSINLKVFNKYSAKYKTEEIKLELLKELINEINKL